MTKTAECEGELTVHEVVRLAERCAWSALVMTPIIWLVQGPSVSTDQFVVRTALVLISALAGIGLRTLTLIARRRAVPLPEESGVTVRPVNPGDNKL
jgi:hypothetical protein